MSPATSIGGGRADVATKDFPSIAGLYESANRNQLGASEAAAHLALQASSTQAGLSERQGELAVHQQQAEADRQQRMLMVSAEVSAQQQAMRQRAETQAWLQGQELSQAESMHLQRQQNALGYLQAEHTAGRLDDDTYYGLATQLRTGIDPMRQRQEATRAKMMQQQQEAVAHQNAAAETMQQQDMAFAAGNLDKLPLVTDPNTGKKHRMLRDKNGKWYDPFEGNAKAGPDFQEREHELKQQREDQKDFAAAVHEAEQSTREWARPGKTDDKGNTEPSAAEVELGRKPTSEDRRDRITGLVKETMGATSRDEFMRQQQDARHRLRHPPEKIAAPTPTGERPEGQQIMAPPPKPNDEEIARLKKEQESDIAEQKRRREEAARAERARQGKPDWLDRHVFTPVGEAAKPAYNRWQRMMGREEAE